MMGGGTSEPPKADEIDASAVDYDTCEKGETKAFGVGLTQYGGAENECVEMCIKTMLVGIRPGVAEGTCADVGFTEVAKEEVAGQGMQGAVPVRIYKAKPSTCPAMNKAFKASNCSGKRSLGYVIYENKCQEAVGCFIQKAGLEAAQYLFKTEEGCATALKLKCKVLGTMKATEGKGGKAKGKGKGKGGRGGRGGRGGKGDKGSKGGKGYKKGGKGGKTVEEAPVMPAVNTVIPKAETPTAASVPACPAGQIPAYMLGADAKMYGASDEKACVQTCVMEFVLQWMPAAKKGACSTDEFELVETKQHQPMGSPMPMTVSVFSPKAEAAPAAAPTVAPVAEKAPACQGGQVPVHMLGSEAVAYGGPDDKACVQTCVMEFVLQWMPTAKKGECPDTYTYTETKQHKPMGSPMAMSVSVYTGN